MHIYLIREIKCHLYRYIYRLIVVYLRYAKKFNKEKIHLLVFIFLYIYDIFLSHFYHIGIRATVKKNKKKKKRRRKGGEGGGGEEEKKKEEDKEV